MTEKPNANDANENMPVNSRNVNKLNDQDPPKS